MKLSPMGISSLLVVVALCANPVLGDDWWQFRGPGGSGIANGPGLPKTWSETENVKWSVEIPGEGWASPIVTGGRVIIATAVPEGEGGRDGKMRWEVHCFDANTGEAIWKRVAAEGKPRVGTHRDNTYASETPASNGHRIITYFGMTGVYCYDWEGKLLWEKDLGAYQMQGDWGTSSSPVIHNDRVFIQVDNEEDSFLVALNVETGEEVWRKAREEGSNWGSIVVWQNSKRTELVTSGSKARSYDPDSGELLWEAEIGTGGVSSSPSAVGDLMFVGSSGRRSRSNLVAIKAGASGDLDEEGNTGIAWRTSEAAPSRSSPLVYEGHVYILDNRGGIVVCLDAESGDVMYRERMPNGGAFWASPYAFDGAVFCPADNGITYVLNAGKDFELITTNELEGRFWATPAVVNNSIYIRSAKKLYCIEKN